MKEMISKIIAIVATIDYSAALAIIAGKHVEVYAERRWNCLKLHLVFKNNKLAFNNLVGEFYHRDEKLKEIKRQATLAALYYIDARIGITNNLNVKVKIVND